MQLMYICESLYLLCSPVANADILFLLWLDLFSKYSSTADFKNSRSLTISVSLLINFMKSQSSAPLLWFHLIVNTSLDLLSLDLSLALSTYLITAYRCLLCQKHSNFADAQYFPILSKRFEAFDMLQYLLI